MFIKILIFSQLQNYVTGVSDQLYTFIAENVSQWIMYCPFQSASKNTFNVLRNSARWKSCQRKMWNTETSESNLGLFYFKKEERIYLHFFFILLHIPVQYPDDTIFLFTSISLSLSMWHFWHVVPHFKFMCPIIPCCEVAAYVCVPGQERKCTWESFWSGLSSPGDCVTSLSIKSFGVFSSRSLDLFTPLCRKWIELSWCCLEINLHRFTLLLHLLHPRFSV